MKAILKNVRFAYAHVFTPDDMSGKYSVRIIIRKDNTTDLEAIKKAWKEALEAGQAKLGTYKPKLSELIHDGDEEGMAEEYAGCYYINAKSKTKPEVVKLNTSGLGSKVIQITDESEFFSGCYGMASVAFFAYNQGVNKGIGVGLNSVLKVKGDNSDYLGGRSSAESDYKDALGSTAAGFGVVDDDDVL